MSTPQPTRSIRWDSSLIEKAVLAVVATRPPDMTSRFHRDRDAAYAQLDSEARDAAFARLHRAWFTTFGLHVALDRALDELPLLTSRVAEYRVVAATTRAHEHADLFDRTDPGARLGDESDGAGCRDAVGFVALVRLRPESFLDQDRLLHILRHELRHLADMVDPAFGYCRVLPTTDLGPAYDRVLRDRYRCVWDVTIDGRLATTGLASRDLRERRAADFARTFPGLHGRLATCFNRWFDDRHPTHEAIVEFILRPSGESTDGGHTARCPVCRFPTAGIDAARLPEGLVARIKQDHPAWRETDGLCRQCDDLYRARVETETLQTP